MDSLQFAASLVESLAWPIVVAVLAIVYRKHIARLLGLISKLKAGPIEAEFAREVKELRSEIDPAGATAAFLDADRARLVALARVSSRSAIIEAWQLVEFATRDVLTRSGKTLPQRAIESPLSLGRLLSELGGLTSDDMDLYNQLRRLRNEAVHAKDFEPSEEATLNFIELALRLYSTIRNLSGLNRAS